LNTSASEITPNVSVTATARLHLGFVDLSGSLGRRFGSIGLAITGFRTCVTLRKAQRLRVTGPESERAQACLETMQRVIGSRDKHVLTVDEIVPAHAGFGSGTQLALAIAVATRRLHGLPLDIDGDAIRLGRGLRSGTGIGLFHRGGFVLDGGRGPDDVPPPIISRIPFPETWRVLVVLDPARRGMHGTSEHAAFASLPPFSDRDAADLCRLVLMKALPALADRDIVNFGSAITELQARLGDYYAPTQGGRFSSTDVASILDLLDHEGAAGIGQSSWGPTGFAFAASQQQAERLLAAVHRDADERGLEIRICTGLNRGAEILASTAAHVPVHQ